MHETGYLKIAMTTDSLVEVDAGFISAKHLVFYDVTAASSDFVDVLRFAGPAGGELPKGTGRNGGACCGWAVDDGKSSDRVSAMIDALAGCSILFTRGLSDPQAVRVKNAGVFPVVMEMNRDIADVIDRLQVMLSDNPPLWMVRVLKNAPHGAYASTMQAG